MSNALPDLQAMRDVAEKMGLDATVRNVGYPDPFLIVRFPPAHLAAPDGNEMVFDGMATAIKYDEDRDERWQFVAYQYGGDWYRHPHSSSSIVQPHEPFFPPGTFCFGGGNNWHNLNILLQGKNMVGFFGLMKVLFDTYSNNGAYFGLPSEQPMSNDLCRCLDPDGSYICHTCEHTEPGTKESIHFTDLVFNGQRWLSKNHIDLPLCPNCGYIARETFATDDGGEGCFRCTLEYDNKFYRKNHMQVAKDGKMYPSDLVRSCRKCKLRAVPNITCAYVECEMRGNS